MNNEEKQRMVLFSVQESAPELDEQALEDVKGANRVPVPRVPVPQVSNLPRFDPSPIYQGPLRFPVTTAPGVRITPRQHSALLRGSDQASGTGSRITSAHVIDANNVRFEFD